MRRACLASNEKELSHRWRKRASLQGLALKSYKGYSSERPAVGWSDWLDRTATPWRNRQHTAAHTKGNTTRRAMSHVQNATVQDKLTKVQMPYPRTCW